MKHLSTLHLHQLRYGELPQEHLEGARRHLAECPRCASRLAVQERERAAFEVLPVPGKLLAPTARPRRWWSLGIAGGLLALAAGLALFVAAPDPLAERDPSASGTRVRGEGGVDLEVWVDRGKGARPLREGERLRAGDRVQLVIDPDGATTLTLGGIDGAGLFEIYGTFEPESPKEPAIAPFSLTLDDAPGPQRFFAVRSNGELPEPALKDAVERGVHPRGVSVVSVDLPKE